MAKKRITTIEELARITQDELLGINGRIDRLEGKVDAGFDRMDAGFDVIADKFAAIDTKLDTGFKSIIGLIRVEREDRKRDHAALERRVSRLEQKIFMK